MCNLHVFLYPLSTLSPTHQMNFLKWISYTYVRDHWTGTRNFPSMSLLYKVHVCQRVAYAHLPWQILIIWASEIHTSRRQRSFFSIFLSITVPALCLVQSTQTARWVWGETRDESWRQNMAPWRVWVDHCKFPEELLPYTSLHLLYKCF